MIQDHVKDIPVLRSYRGLVPVLLIIIITVIVHFRKKTVLLEKWTQFLNYLLLIYCVVDIVTILMGINVEDHSYANKLTGSVNSSLVKLRPNVYFLLFDEYPGYKSLRDSFGFKNEVFYKKLSDDSFTIIPTFSNYSGTAFSMSSIFNMDYVNKKNLNETSPQRELQERGKEIENAAVFNVFSQLGYEIQSFSVFDVLDKKSIGGNSFILGHSRLLTDKMFHNRFIKDVAWQFINGNFSIPAFQQLYFGEIKTYNARAEEGLIASLDKKNNSPRFIYAHFLMPHQPYFFDSVGREQNIARLEDAAVLADKSLFLSYLQYANKKIGAFADLIVQKDSSAIVILLSDHGFRAYQSSKKYEPYKFDNFCAIRYTGSKPLPASLPISNVNLFRYIFNECFYQHLPYLENKVSLLKEKDR
ncbi:MAG: sulfatase-like hydrolase/transferase [Ginsengibacter sp.]